MTCAESGRVCVSGALQGAPSHRRAAVTYGPGPCNQLCKTGPVLHGDDAMIAVRGRSKLKACVSYAAGAWGPALTRSTPARENAPRAPVGLARQPHRKHPIRAHRNRTESSHDCRLSCAIFAICGGGVTLLTKNVLHERMRHTHAGFGACLASNRLCSDRGSRIARQREFRRVIIVFSRI
jgi:hypothetical protein